jgi:hypothetical protein
MKANFVSRKSLKAKNWSQFSSDHRGLTHNNHDKKTRNYRKLLKSNLLMLLVVNPVTCKVKTSLTHEMYQYSCIFCRYKQNENLKMLIHYFQPLLCTTAKQPTNAVKFFKNNQALQTSRICYHVSTYWNTSSLNGLVRSSWPQIYWWENASNLFKPMQKHKKPI